jgi:hypothetical protein
MQTNIQPSSNLPHPIDISTLQYRPGKNGEILLSYKPTKFGQATFLLSRCKEERIGAHYYNNQIQIHSLNKADKLVNLIQEALHYETMPDPDLTEEVTVYKNNKKLLAIAVKTEQTLYIPEDKTFDVICYIYKKQIPRLLKLHFFNDLKEMETYFLTKNILI